MNKKVAEILAQHNLTNITDKDTFHSYGKIYDEVLSEFINSKGSLLEIGVSWGGSLILWQELLKNFKIVGIDIENNIHESVKSKLKLSDNTVQLLFQDAYSVNTVNYLKTIVPNGFDVIIDDGPHTEESQLKCIELYLDCLNNNGVLIIEDILNFDFLEKLKNNIPKSQNFDYEVTVYDHRKEKNKIDDVIFMVKKTMNTNQQLQRLLKDYVFNSENYQTNFDLAFHYESIGQLASAVSYYLRAAERTNVLINQYESLIRASMCFDRQGTRNFTVKGLLQNAISICPTRPEAYYLLSRFYEFENKDGNWKDSFLIASIGEHVCKFNAEPLKTKVDYPGIHALLYQKALSAWWCGLCHESRNIFNDLNQNYNLDENFKSKVLMHLEKFNETGKNLHHVYDKKEDFDWGIFKNNNFLNNCFKKDILDNRFYEKLFEVEEGDIVLDIGASVGPFTYSILNKKPKTVICLEPHSKLFNTLKSNLSNCSNVICLNKGISKVDGNVLFETLYDETTDYTSWEKNERGTGLTLSSLIKEYNLEKIDFLKIDCEGGEYDFFSEENFDWIITNVKKISGEWHFYKEDKREKFYEFREKYLKHFKNFKILFIDNDSNSFDITEELWNDDFCQKYGWVNIYIDNRQSIQLSNSQNKTKVIDYCSFYGPYGSEMLLLRYHILKDYVDEFVVSESSYSHTGIPVKFECKNKLKEWGLPEHRFKVIELNTPPDDELVLEEIDELNCLDFISGNTQSNLKSKLARVRDRFSKDALLKVLDEYDDNTVFIHGDVDEIINPLYIPSVVNACKTNINGFTYIPLIYLEGRADLRVYNRTWNCPQAWDWAMFACSKSVLKKLTPTKIRSNKLIPSELYSFFINDYYTNKPYTDIGWHFSWMGGKESRLIKKQSWEHRYDSYDWLVTKNYDQSDEFLNNDYNEGDIPPCGNVELVLKKFPKEYLPKEIFELPIVEKFLFPGTLNDR
jgi:FkbM family methyltransferase